MSHIKVYYMDRDKYKVAYGDDIIFYRFHPGPKIAYFEQVFLQSVFYMLKQIFIIEINFKE